MAGESLGLSRRCADYAMRCGSLCLTAVYKNPVAKGEESKARRHSSGALYLLYAASRRRCRQDFLPQLTFEGIPRTVCDYIAGMTDKYAVFKYDELFIPKGWQVR